MVTLALPSVREKRIASLKESHNKPEVLNLISQRSKEMWRNEEIRQKMAVASHANWTNPEKKASYLAAMAAGRDTPEYTAKLSAASKIHRNDPATKEAYSMLMKSLIWITDGTKNKRVPPSDSLPEGWRLGRAPGLFKPGTFDARTARLKDNPEYLQKLSAAQTAAWANDEDRRKNASDTMREMRSSEGAVAQYERVRGSVWITNGTRCQRISPDDPIPVGWRRGKLSSKGKPKT